MLRYADLRLDASSIRELSDGSIKVTGQLTHPGIFDYQNPDGSRRREYRPADEVFKKAALETFAGVPVTINHPVMKNGARLVSSETWKQVAIGHLGDNVREDAGHVVADIYIRDAAAVAMVKGGQLRHISCGYNVDYDATPGETAGGDRYDGVQRNIRGNHVALLPQGIAPRGGSECVLRLDSNGDEEITRLKSDVDLEQALAKIAALEGELSKSRADAAELPNARKAAADAQAEVARLTEQLSPARLDSMVEARGSLTASAKSQGVETAGKSNLAIKRAIVAKRTPSLASRVDSMSEEAIDGCMAVYAEQPTPSMDVLGLGNSQPPAPKAPEGNSGMRADSTVPTYESLYNKHLQASRNAWQNSGDKPVRN